MIILYLLIGLIASIIGALPLGASNIVVMNTTIKHNVRQAIKIAIAAGVSEVILSYYALHCNMVVTDFFNDHKWVQVSIVLLLMLAGSILFFKKNNDDHQKRRPRSKYLTGFLLGILNPPVLIYWIVVFSFINNQEFMLSIASPLSVLFVFFLGVYIGKLLTLYLYSKFSLSLKNKYSNLNQVINKVTGVLLVVIGIAQAIRLSF